MVKIIDVARHAGVSTATVSRVLNKHPRVAAELREQVEQAVTELGYSLNVTARALRTRQASKILLSVPDISNPFFADIIKGAEETARAAGYSVILGDTDGDPQLEEQYATLIDRREVDGLVILGHSIPATIRDLMARARRTPLPVVHGCEYSPDLGIPSVHIDNFAAGFDGANHLLSLRHRVIGVITGRMDSPLSADRLAGAKAAIDVCGAQLSVQEGDFSIASGYACTRVLAERGATAIFCFSDEMALGAFRALADLGLACPDDISVLGFDDIRFADYTSPRLTTIAQPRRQIGRTTVELLLAQLLESRETPSSITLPHRLITRDSTAMPPN